MAPRRATGRTCNVGEELTPVVKGPLTLRDLVTWVMGAGSPYMRAHRFALEYERRHPSLAMIDSQTGQIDVPELVHMEETRAQEIGIPGAYDYGCQRSSWLGHVLTNWMGDDGFLKKLYMELRRFNVVGDTTWCKGKVTRKYVENGEALVDVEVWAENQRGEITAPGRAVVRLAVEITRMKPGPLTALRIIEYSTSMAAAASGKMLADLGAEVIKVEPPRTRRSCPLSRTIPRRYPRSRAQWAVSLSQCQQARHHARSGAAYRSRAAARPVGRGRCLPA